MTGRALESLAGKLMHWSQINDYSKALVYNSLIYIFNNIRNEIINKSDIIILPLSVINDLKFWLEFVDHLNNVPMHYILRQPSINIYAATVASSFGRGYIF